MVHIYDDLQTFLYSIHCICLLVYYRQKKTAQCDWKHVKLSRSLSEKRAYIKKNKTPYARLDILFMPDAYLQLSNPSLNKNLLMAFGCFCTPYRGRDDKRAMVAGATFWFYLLCVSLSASSGSSEGEPQEEGDGGEDQESQAGKGESRAREAGTPAEEEAADWHEQRYATSPHAATGTETGRQVGSWEDGNRRVESGVSWNIASHRFELWSTRVMWWSGGGLIFIPSCERIFFHSSSKANLMLINKKRGLCCTFYLFICPPVEDKKNSPAPTSI